MTKHSWSDLHMIRTVKAFGKSLYYTLGVFVLLFVLLRIGGSLYISHISNKTIDDFKSGISRDLAHLKTEGDELAQSDILKKYIQSKDSEKLIEFTKAEIIKRHIGLMGVVDKNGIVLSRTNSTGNLGNNSFLVNPVARVVAEGKYAESIEATYIFDPSQIFLTTGRPVNDGGDMIGALFANYLADDVYAIRFQDSYLPKGTKVVFYNKNAGVYGNGFAESNSRKLINSYFDVGSDWIKNGRSGETISFDDGSFYLVENIIFPGLEESPGGAFLFIPREDFSKTVNLSISIFVLLIFVLFTLKYHFLSKNEEQGWRYYSLLVFIAGVVFVVSFSSLHLENIGYSKLERVPYILYNSTIRIQPEFGIYDMDFDQKFSVFVDTGDESINTVQIGLLYDPKAVEVKDIIPDTDVCSYVIEKNIDVKAGKVDLACVLLKSDIDGRQSLKLADIVVKPLHVGVFTLSFDSDNTKVLANDGLGTDVLRASQPGSYRVDNFDPILTDTEVSNTSSDKRPFVVFSPTHPNQSRWYNTDYAHFVWRGQPGAVYKYAFDNHADTIPSNDKTIQGTSIKMPVPGDGVFYFHLQLVDGSPVVHYEIQEDKTPPTITSINLSSENIIAGDVVRFSFESYDNGSGIQKNYYVDLGNHLFLPTGLELFVPFIEPGDQKLVLRVYDDAGNYSEKTQIIHVQAK